MAFHDIQLPTQVEKGAVGGPNFVTTVLAMSSGNEQRNADWGSSRGIWDVTYGISTKADFDTVKQFFYARRGKWAGFRFKDWSDYQVTGNQIGIGDGATNTFQLIKTYEPAGPLPYYRNITRPVAGTTVVYLNGVPVVSTAWSIPTPGTGLLVFGAAPAAGVVITYDTEFDVPVRFDVDKFDIVLETDVAGSVGQLIITEIREGGL